MHLHLCWLLTLMVSFLVASQARAQAGPPYQTDDPDPVPYRHFEAYIFSLSDTTRAAGTAWAGPTSFEMNYGAAPRLQLHVAIPFVQNFAPGGTVTHGIGDTELGAKFKLWNEAKYLPEAGIFPFIELPTGDSERGLGVGKTWYRVPLWLKKSFGEDWSVYAGGGETIVPQEGQQNFSFGGLLVQHKLTPKLVLGVELYGHGAQGPLGDAPDRATLADFGGYYAFTDHFQFLFAAGHSVFWAPEIYTYAAAYWTWGTGAEPGEDKSSQKLLHVLLQH